MNKNVLFLSFFAITCFTQITSMQTYDDSKKINNVDNRLSMRIVRDMQGNKGDEAVLEFIANINNKQFEFLNNYYKVNNVRNNELRKKQSDKILFKRLKERRKAIDAKILARTKLSE